MPLVKSARAALFSDWALAAGICGFSPVLLFCMLLSVLTQLVRRARRLSTGGCFTARVQARILALKARDLLSVGAKIQVACIFVIIIFLGPIISNVFLALIMEAISNLHASLILVIVVIVGIFALLVPVVPTTTVYVFGGIVVPRKWMSLPPASGGFWMGVAIVIVLSLGVKLGGRYLQYKQKKRPGKVQP